MITNKETYNQNYSEKDIEDYLANVKDIMKNKRLIVSGTDKNEESKEKYSLTDRKIKSMVNELEAKDFGYSIPNDSDDPRFCDEVLYTFCRTYELTEFGETQSCDVELFIKINSLKDVCIIVSFHEAEKAFNYCFT